MESIDIQNTLEILKNNESETITELNNSSFGLARDGANNEILKTKGYETFSKYIDRIGLAKDPNLVILSSVNHYYYDNDEMKDITTVVNIKLLNHIDRTDNFLNSIVSMLPENANFVGCFEENNKPLDLFRNNSTPGKIASTNPDDLENGIVSKSPILNMIYNFMDARTYNSMTEKSVTLLLENHDFKVLDFTNINGLIYFHARINRADGN
jgi:hypothetical protein